MRQLIAGNWKMNGLSAALSEIVAVRSALEKTPPPCDVLICPPATLIARAAAAAGSVLEIGGQDCHPEISGAFTGDISAEMIADAGARAVIVGHSERRQYHGENDAIVAAKASAAWRAGLRAIICIGESEAQRDAGATLDICAGQLGASIPERATPANTEIAYEPIWAIGTGRVPESADIVATHAHIRRCLLSRFGNGADGFRILYGGSVKASNAREILALANVDGALVGGASLKAGEFLAIVEAAQKNR
jgi:triosephosphate isomerase